MVRNLFVLAAAAVVVGGCISVHETKRVCEDETSYADVEAKAPIQVLRHVVLFKFNEGTSAGDIRKIESAFCALPTKIDAIYDFEWGTDVSVEDLAQGYTHCFFVTFRSEADRDAYLPHPEHKKFGEILRPHLEQVLVVDYWTK